MYEFFEHNVFQGLTWLVILTLIATSISCGLYCARSVKCTLAKVMLEIEDLFLRRCYHFPMEKPALIEIEYAALISTFTSWRRP